MTVTQFDTFEDAVRITNSVVHGLTAMVFTKDQLKANQSVRAIDVTQQDIFSDNTALFRDKRYIFSCVSHSPVAATYKVRPGEFRVAFSLHLLHKS
ncbi:hypothetical protein GGR54DRAFT_592769 [Hypoxylon sp. NC1633]|nr:hypothetical protein GGR54DRAFT_592769 [Hypoxylon sp. NC1633]